MTCFAENGSEITPFFKNISSSFPSLYGGKLFHVEDFLFFLE